MALPNEENRRGFLKKATLDGLSIRVCTDKWKALTEASTTPTVTDEDTFGLEGDFKLDFSIMQCKKRPL